MVRMITKIGSKEILKEGWAFIGGCHRVNHRYLMKTKSENTQLLCKGKYHCSADLLLDWFGFGLTSKSVESFNATKQLNPNQSNRRSAIQ